MSFKINSAFSEKCLLSALIIFLFVTGAAVFGFVAGVSIMPYTILIGIGVFFILSFFTDKKLFMAGLINVLLLCAFTLICSRFFDWSYDGMYYHKQAVITLKEGWNPLYQTALECDVFAGYPDMSLWLENYPKGLWIFSASIYALTNLLETAKAVNILFISAVFFAAYNVMRTVYSFSMPKSILIGTLFAANPVFISQMFTFYNDLTVGALFIIALLLCLKLYTNRANFCTYASLFCVTVISPLIKFTSPALLALIYIVFGIACAVKNRRNPKWMIKPVSIIISGFLAGVFILGFDPYTEHIIHGQHIIHPVMGSEKYDIMNTNPPKGFDNKNPVLCVLTSVFSKSSNDIKSYPELKIPFSISPEEIEPLSNADTRIGGFGVLFSGILLLAIISAAISRFSGQKPQRELCITIIFLFLLALFFPESWWARYASFIYYLPIFLLVYAFQEKKASALCLLCSVIIAVNTAITLYSVISAGINITNSLNTKLSEIKEENKKIILRVNDFPTHVKLFSEYGINFEISHEPISPGESIFYRNTKYKFID